MKKIKFVLVSALALGLVTALSCSKPSPAPVVIDNPPESNTTCTDGGCAVLEAAAPEAAPVDGPQVISDENWEFTVPAPGSDWYTVKVKLPSPDIKVMLTNEKVGCKILLIKESTKETYPEYVVAVLRGLTSGGGKVQSATQIESNGTKFVLVNATMNHVSLWMWVTQKDSYGYAFTCGGPVTVDSGTAMRDVCNTVGSTFKIK